MIDTIEFSADITLVEKPQFDGDLHRKIIS